MLVLLLGRPTDFRIMEPAAEAASTLVGPLTASALTTLPSLAHNIPLVGISWVASSAILTTYSTTRFLKYGSTNDIQGKKRLGDLPSVDVLYTEGRRVLKRDMPKTKKVHSLAPAVPTPINKETPLPEKRNPLSQVDRPTLLTLFRFSGSLLLGLFAPPDIWNVKSRFHQNLALAQDFAPSAFFLFVANYCNSIALDRIGIPLTYTSKCGIPLITVLLTLLLDGRKALPSVPALFSLIPIALGIAAASWNSPTFETTGFVAAIVSTTAQAALIIASKRAMTKTLVTGQEAQRAMVGVALVIAIVMTLGNSLLERLKQPSPNEDASKSTQAAPHGCPPLWLSLSAVASYHIEYCLSFMFVNLVTPITFGTCDAIRRLAIIVSGKHMFGGPKFSLVNLLGIGLALVGALLYSLTN